MPVYGRWGARCRKKIIGYVLRRLPVKALIWPAQAAKPRTAVKDKVYTLRLFFLPLIWRQTLPSKRRSSYQPLFIGPRVSVAAFSALGMPGKRDAVSVKYAVFLLVAALTAGGGRLVLTELSDDACAKRSEPFSLSPTPRKTIWKKF